MYNVIVVGAGWYGLAAARAYIQDHPNDNVLVIEAESTCGSTWSNNRLYPGLKSNNLWGSYEYPEFPMLEEVYGVTEGQHIPAAVLHRCLTDFAKKFGVFEKTRFDTKVTSVESTSTETWKISVTSSEFNGGDEVLETEKLILTTGQETFTPRLLHAKEFCVNADTVNTCKKAVVVGAVKSAFDCAYAYAPSEGSVQVDLIIRATGDVPVWLCPPYITPFLQKMEGLLCTRALTWFNPCPWGAEEGYGIVRRFLHNTGIGNFIVNDFWNVLSMDVVNAHGYNDHPEVFKLKPWQSPMWTGSGVGIHNYETNFYDLVRQGKIRVHLADILRPDGATVNLTNGEVIETDIVLCAMGWRKEPSLEFIKFDRGLKQQNLERERLINDANVEIRSMFPMLNDQPVLRREQPKGEPLHNYRFIVPSQSVFKKNIAYAGMVSTVFTSVFASVQGLWISAYFDGKLQRALKSEVDVTKEVMLHTQFGRWRYPCGYGASLPDFAFDSVPYVDLLLNDLGLKAHRKTSTIVDLVEAYKPADYAGVAQEWENKQ
ncbi:FAD-dependent monooxygenase DEP4 [Colletotrichum spaethianum]|uniref:FAD-dependent monooxygenase DEP4 n=1 Tax=Colletotrichum spaethianum TaxID=700344 RepID=A0AA37PCN1_9PEZI|nr:FAD-dependent monooxygenase DEP4 [Colletotrichum spaethianum]GKT49744.1 FAD-dependent monooxygenase DEP4 [Colletotrichum spaethianum]